MGLEEFVRVCDRFTNKKLFVTDARGELVRDAHGNLERINDDNVDTASVADSSPAADAATSAR
jgi:hypothetical protein